MSNRLLGLCLAILSVVLVAGCDAEPRDVPPVAAPSGADCPLDAAACAFAQQLAGWVEGHDVDAILAHSAPQEHLCQGPDPDVGLGRPYSVCHEVPAGERRLGYPVGRLSSDAGVIRSEHFRDELSHWLMWTQSAAAERADVFGPGALRLVSLGCPLEHDGMPQPADPTACTELFVVAFSGIVLSPPFGVPYRGAGFFLVRQSEGAPPRITGFAQGGLLEEPHVRAVLSGGRANVFVQPFAPGVPVFGTFFPLTPPGGTPAGP